jgi:hypothetical protein
MYIKITGNLLDVMGENARDMEKTGVIIYSHHQMEVNNQIVSYGKIVDAEKAAYMLNNPAVVTFETMEETNADIDATYEVKYMLSDIAALQLDLQLSGNPVIPGYDSAQTMTSQVNLKALYDAGMAGISVNKKSDHFAQ